MGYPPRYFGTLNKSSKCCQKIMLVIAGIQKNTKDNGYAYCTAERIEGKLNTHQDQEAEPYVSAFAFICSSMPSHISDLMLT